MEPALTNRDRLLRALFVALAVGLGWGIRGDFGHVLGAAYPGAILGLAFSYVAGQRAAFNWMPVLGLLGGIGISLGGMMSYGMLHGYAKSDTVLNYGYGFLALIMQGGAWGCFGCVLIGLALERRPLSLAKWANCLFTVYLSGVLFYGLVVRAWGFHINPGRSDLSIGFTGGVIGLIGWLVVNRKHYALKGALLGYAGFGLGMAFCRLLANALYADWFPPINNWNVMEVGTGFFGGLVFTYGMLGKRFPEPPQGRWFGWASALGGLYALAAIPVLHRVNRIPTEQRLEEWAANLAAWGYPEPEALAQTVLSYIHLMCWVAVVGAIAWVVLHRRNVYGAAAFPVLFLSLFMLLFQNFNALYFYYERKEGSINMHFVFWVLFALMVLFVVAFEVGTRRKADAWERAPVDTDEAVERVPWRRIALTGLAVYLFILVAAAFTNGEKTMASGNMRWPEWVWRDGPPPERGFLY